jgi:hypothetical protein
LRLVKLAKTRGSAESNVLLPAVWRTPPVGGCRFFGWSPGVLRFGHGMSSRSHPCRREGSTSMIRTSSEEGRCHERTRSTPGKRGWREE